MQFQSPKNAKWQSHFRFNSTKELVKKRDLHLLSTCLVDGGRSESHATVIGPLLLCHMCTEEDAFIIYYDSILLSDANNRLSRK